MAQRDRGGGGGGQRGGVSGVVERRETETVIQTERQGERESYTTVLWLEYDHKQYYMSVAVYKHTST